VVATGPAVPLRPSRAELLGAYGTTIPDLVRPGLKVLLVGINPSLYSGWAGQHFARPGNRLWATLELAGLTPRRLHPSETTELLAAGIGVTNLVARATARADELTDDEVRAGLPGLAALAAKWQPQWVAMLGVGVWRIASGNRKAALGPQPETLGGRRVWVLPNPSGLNAHYQLADLGRLYGELADALDAP
jgi:TDG/mug DNA glycosylase family protein